MPRIQSTAQTITVFPDANASTATSALTGGQTMLMYDPQITFEATREATNPVTTGALQRYTRIGSQRGEITFTTPLYCTSAGGTAGTDLSGTHADPLLNLWYASGWGATLSNTSTVYNLADLDHSHQRVAVVFSNGNTKMALRHCLASPTLTISARQEVQIQWTVMGILQTDADYSPTASIPSLPALSEYTISPAQAKGISLSVRQTHTGTADTISEIYGLEIQLGNNIELPEDLAAENGFAMPVFTSPRDQLGGNFTAPVPSSGDSAGRALQRSQTEGRITAKFYSDDSTASDEISWEVDFSPVAVTECSPSGDNILSETTNFMAVHDLDTTNRRPVVTVLDSRLTG